MDNKLRVRYVCCATKYYIKQGSFFKTISIYQLLAARNSRTWKVSGSSDE